MGLEERFGVNVDLRIPEGIRNYFYAEWGKWLTETGRYAELGLRNILTRYEHLLIGSGVGLPPDPFKPLAAFASFGLEEVIRYRRTHYPAGSTLQVFASGVSNFRRLTGFKTKEYDVLAELPDIADDGRVGIPKVVGGCRLRNR